MKSVTNNFFIYHEKCLHWTFCNFPLTQTRNRNVVYCSTSIQLIITVSMIPVLDLHSPCKNSHWLRVLLTMTMFVKLWNWDVCVYESTYKSWIKITVSLERTSKSVRRSQIHSVNWIEVNVFRVSICWLSQSEKN